MQKKYLSKYQTTIKASVNKVWEALTKPEIVKKYFFGSDLITDWKIGSPIIWTGEFEGQSYTDRGIIQAFDLNKKISFSYLSSWSDLENKPENYLFVTYELSESDNGTVLTITQSNYDAEKAKHSENNWAMVIEALKKIIE